MRVTSDESGKICFAPEEWQTGMQSFSRLAATQRQPKKEKLKKYLLQIPKPSVRKTFKRGQ